MTAELVRRTEVTRLGAGVDADGRLRDDAMERVFATLDDYRAEIDAHGVQTARRRADQRRARLGQRRGVRRRRARPLRARAPRPDRRRGGAADLPRRHQRARPADRDADAGDRHRRRLDRDDHRQRRRGAASTSPRRPASCARPSATCTPTRRPPPSWPRSSPTSARSSRQRSRPTRRRAVQRGIAVAGTATSLAAIAQDLDPYDPERVHGYVLERRRVATASWRGSRRCRSRERREVAGLHPDRAPTIVAGVADPAGRCWGCSGSTQIEVSEHDILRGAALALAATGVE